MTSSKLPIVPAGLFGMVLGIVGLGSAWRAAHRVWQLPALVGEALIVTGMAVWAILLALFVLKWLAARDEALAEARHPVQCCLIALVGVSTMLVGVAALPYSRPVGAALFGAGAVFAVAFAVWRTGLLWQGARDPATTTPVLYLPTVGAGFALAIGASALGALEWARVAFGIGLFTWLAIESVLLHRLYTAVPLPLPLRPTLGIQLAPPTVGAVAYLGIATGPPDWFADALIGYGLLQAAILIRLLPWIRQQPFTASYWGFTFGITALATAPLRAIERGDDGAVAELAPYLFVAANVAMALIAGATLRLMLQRRLLAAPTGPPSSPGPSLGRPSS